MAGTADAIVIGAGVIGAATALELARRGVKVVGIDRNAQAGHGSTSGSCAIVRVHYSTLDGTALAYESYFHWRDWIDYLAFRPKDAIAFREIGCLVMKTDLNGNMARHTAMAAELGIPHEHWDATQIRDRLPLFDLRRFAPAKRPEDPGFGAPTGGEIDGAVFFPTAGYVTDPALSAQNLREAAEAGGASFRLGAEVAEILIGGGRIAGVRLADGDEIHAPVVVNVAGPASAAVNAMAGVTGDMGVTTRALRQEVVHLPAPEGLYARGEVIISDSDIACYSRPEQGGNVLIGSEDPPCDPHEWVEDERAFDRDFSEQWRAQAMRFAQRVPEVGIPSRMRGIVDLYDVSDDWIPIYDRSALPGFYMACGTSGNQFKNAPVAGRIMAELVCRGEAGHDHDAEPISVELPHVGRALDIGFFSRRRQVNPDSSFSVLG